MLTSKQWLFNRRSFFYLGFSALGAIAGKKWIVANSNLPTTIEPATMTAKTEGMQEIFLEARLGKVKLGNQTAQLFTYNGQMPGPIITTKPGDRLRIHLSNQLSQKTNLHFHGLHISPMGNADNIMIEVDPGKTFTYEFTLPKNHPSGTFWYHPHLHDSTAEQVFNGLTGLIIVRGELDEIPEIKAAKENILIFKDFALDNEGQVVTPSYHDVMMTGREGPILTVNGEINPTFTLPQGGLLRLRLLNASSSRFYRLSLENHPLYLIATDGIALAEPVELSELLLIPGQRAELLVKGDRPPQSYRLLNLPYNRGGMGMGRGGMGGGMGGGMMNHGGFEPSTEPETLAIFEYQGQVEPLSLPLKLMPIQAIAKPQIQRQFRLDSGMGQFTINGEVFDEHHVNFKVKLNTIEEWEISSQGMPMEHPFHVHTNHYQVISRNGIPEPFLAWRDTVLIRPGEVVRLRVKFNDFVGKSFYHCHIFDHADRGMMGMFEIVETT